MCTKLDYHPHNNVCELSAFITLFTVLTCVFVVPIKENFETKFLISTVIDVWNPQVSVSCVYCGFMKSKEKLGHELGDFVVLIEIKKYLCQIIHAVAFFLCGNLFCD